MVAIPPPRCMCSVSLIVAVFPVRLPFRAALPGRYLLHRVVCMPGRPDRIVRRALLLSRRVVRMLALGPEVAMLRIRWSLQAIDGLPGVAFHPFFTAAVALRFVLFVVCHAQEWCNA